jgi:hypothetical protein
MGASERSPEEFSETSQPHAQMANVNDPDYPTFARVFHNALSRFLDTKERAKVADGRGSGLPALVQPFQHEHARQQGQQPNHAALEAILDHRQDGQARADSVLPECTGIDRLGCNCARKARRNQYFVTYAAFLAMGGLPAAGQLHHLNLELLCFAI